MFSDVLSALEEVSILVKKYILVTSPEISKDFKQFDKGKYSKIKIEVKELDYQSILRENYLEIHKTLKTLILKNLTNFEVMCELTGGTKPISLALRDLSEKYRLRRLYYSGKKILWL